jgi:hypothetical protein
MADWHDGFRRTGQSLSTFRESRRKPVINRRTRVAGDISLPASAARHVCSRLIFSAVHDREDPGTANYLVGVEWLLPRMTDCDFATCDLHTNEVVNPGWREASSRRAVAIVRHGTLHDNTCSK